MTNVTGWTSAIGGTCSATQPARATFETLSDDNTKTFKEWQYKQREVDVSLLKNGSAWTTASFQWPIGPNGTDRTITWDGCIEERETVDNTTDFDPIPNKAKDLDFDLVPDAATRRPLGSGVAAADLRACGHH